MTQRGKDRLRHAMREARHAMPTTTRLAHSNALCERVAKQPWFTSAQVVASYRPVAAEADPNLLIEAMRRQGAQVALPRITRNRTIQLCFYEVGDTLEKNVFGIDEPRATARIVPPDAVDLIFVPAVAVDLQGHRIGYGKGYYDRLLPTLPTALRCAVVFDFQLVDAVPFERHDCPMHLIATDARIVDLRAETR